MTAKSTPLALAALACSLTIGCDPGGPGAEGTITLDPEVDLTAFETLELRAFPDPDAEFDVAAGIPANGELFAVSHDLAEIEFPFEYLIGGGVGTTEFKRWRVLAWLSVDASDEAPPDGPVSGEWYGTTLFMVDECGGTFGGYCGLTKGVDITIDTAAP